MTIQTIVAIRGGFQCQTCGRIFASRRTGVIHADRVHGPAKCQAMVYPRKVYFPVPPTKCSRNAVEGSQYCRQHGGAVDPEPERDPYGTLFNDDPV